MRSLHKAWQDKRPGWTRRVRWYQGEGHEVYGVIRLKFEDESGSWNAFFNCEADAQEAFNEFRNGAVRVSSDREDDHGN
jgi:hypothetical protein